MKIRSRRSVRHITEPYTKISKTANVTTISRSDVSRINNHIYFYGDVTQSNMMKVNQHIHLLNHQITQRNECEEIDNSCECDNCQPDTIFLHINSPGGEVVAAFSTVDIIRTSPTPIVTIIEGEACSAATMISVVGHERWMHKHAYMLIHQGSDSIEGNARFLTDDFYNFCKMEDDSNQLYLDYSKITREELNETLKHDIMWDSQKCLKVGLVDKII